MKQHAMHTVAPRAKMTDALFVWEVSTTDGDVDDRKTMPHRMSNDGGFEAESPGAAANVPEHFKRIDAQAALAVGHDSAAFESDGEVG